MSAHGWMAEDAFAALERNRLLLETIGTANNEDTTRLRAIDTILFDVLRWDKALTETEKYVRAQGYADYVYGDPSRDHHAGRPTW